MNILITGAASGIGKAVMDCFLNNDHNVYAIDIIKIDEHKNLTSFIVNIKEETSLNYVKQYLIDNDIKLDIIINIAGIHKMTSLVENSFDNIKNLIDINLIGTMLVNNVFYSLLTEKGKIMIVTSEVAAFDPLPFNGLYTVSKNALDSYAQALRQELNLLGQKVITIRPGAIETKLSANSMIDTEYLANNTVLYKKQAKNFLGIAKKFMGKPIKPIKVAKLIYIVSLKKHPKLNYSIHSNLGLVLLNLLPRRMQCFIIKLILNK